MTTLAAIIDLRLLALIGAVVALIFVATVVIMIVRKKILSTEKPAGTGMLMEDFRKLHASGQLSDQEFQALRTRMAAKMKASTPGKGSVHEEQPARGKTVPLPRQQKPLPGSKPPRSE